MSSFFLFFSFFPIVVVVFILENGHCMFLFPAHRTNPLLFFSSSHLDCGEKNKNKKKAGNFM